MNSVQMHLALTHVPVVLSLVGLVMLIIALLTRNSTLVKTSYIIILIAAVATLPVYFSGEGAEEAIEYLPGVSKNLIEEHEEVAKLSMISIGIAGIAALAALLFNKLRYAGKYFKIAVLLIAICSGGLMAQTAHLGGQIRHTEIGTSLAAQNTDNAEENNDANNKGKEQDDD